VLMLRRHVPTLPINALPISPYCRCLTEVRSLAEKGDPGQTPEDQITGGSRWLSTSDCSEVVPRAAPIGARSGLAQELSCA
jgi:hypothetical protein